MVDGTFENQEHKNSKRMRLWTPIIMSFLLVACSQYSGQEAELILPDTADSTALEHGAVLEKAENFRFYIPGIFTHDFKNDIDTSVADNFLNVGNGKLLAKKYFRGEQEYTAITFQYVSTEQGIKKSASHVLTRNEEGDVVDVMSTLFPELDVYAFYDFEDKALKQLEGDEQTVFAGYQLDLSKEDSLGVQFMFCNKKDSFNTQLLNDVGVVKYVEMGKGPY